MENPPPIGVFWDIENCCVPRGKSALAVAQKIRDRFFGGHREAEFMCVCDISKESSLVIQELNDAQVNILKWTMVNDFKLMMSEWVYYTPCVEIQWICLKTSAEDTGPKTMPCLLNIRDEVAQPYPTA